MRFGHKSLTIHLLRGVLGLFALGLAAWGYRHMGWPALALVTGAIWAFRGCPICRTLGLIETMALKVLRQAET